MRQRYAYINKATKITCYRVSTCQIEESPDRIDCIPTKSLRSIDVQRVDNRDTQLSTWNSDVLWLTKVSVVVWEREIRPGGIVAKIGTTVVAAARDYYTSTSRHNGVVYADLASAAVTNTCMAIAFSIDSAFLWTLRVLVIRKLGLGPDAPLSESFVSFRQANTPTT